jgi:hypothetical protein
LDTQNTKTSIIILFVAIPPTIIESPEKPTLINLKNKCVETIVSLLEQSEAYDLGSEKDPGSKLNQPIRPLSTKKPLNITPDHFTFANQQIKKIKKLNIKADTC